MRRRIAIKFPESIFHNKIDFSTKIKEIQVKNIIRFNSCILVGADYSFEYDEFILYIDHPEFESVSEGHQNPVYSYAIARKKFPYLFVSTNPILYRKFK